MQWQSASPFFSPSPFTRLLPSLSPPETDSVWLAIIQNSPLTLLSALTSPTEVTRREIKPLWKHSDLATFRTQS